MLSYMFRHRGAILRGSGSIPSEPTDTSILLYFLTGCIHKHHEQLLLFLSIS